MTVMISDTVRRVLEEDALLREALARGIVNHRAAARWIREREGLDATEEAITSALRRHANAADGGVLEAARNLLARAHVNMRSSVTTVTFSKGAEVRERLPDLLRGIDLGEGGALRILNGSRGLKVILDESNLDAVVNAVGAAHVQTIERELTELSVVLPPEAATTPGVAALVLTSLAADGINVVEFLSGGPDHLVLVERAHALRTFEVISRLIHPRTPPKATPKEGRGGSGASRPDSASTSSGRDARRGGVLMLQASRIR